MLRYVLISFAVAACAPPDPGPTPDGGSRGLPDAYTGCLGAFHVVAPVEGLHYDKSLDVYIDESELQGLENITMIDDLGTTYTSQWDTYEVDPDGNYWARDRYHFVLAAEHRYQLTVSHCDMSETITFFTSP
jgi:hypothetical protein